MSYVIVKSKGTRALNDFEFGGLPIKDRRNKFGETEFSDKMFHFYSSTCSFFPTKEEAECYIEFIKKEINNNKGRYEDVLKGSSDKLMQIANRLRVVDQNESNFAY